MLDAYFYIVICYSFLVIMSNIASSFFNNFLRLIAAVISMTLIAIFFYTPLVVFLSILARCLCSTPVATSPRVFFEAFLISAVNTRVQFP